MVVSSCTYNIVFLLLYTPQHSYGSVTGDRYYGAKATINLWAPHVEGEKEFSLSQIWLVTGRNTNTIEAGWQAC